MTESDIKLLFRNKLNSTDEHYPYNITPKIDDRGWGSAVLEGRGYGIPIASFGDTSDKRVFHPGHLNYSFNYYWERTWGDNSCWEEHVDEEKISEANTRLINIGKKLSEKYKVHLVSVSGSCKGYLSTKLYEIEKIDEDDDLSNDLVLFVYSITDDEMSNF